MSDEPTEMIEILKRHASTVMTTVDARRRRELQGVHPADRRIMRTPPEHVRSLQVNLRISPRFKQRVTAYATTHGLSVTEVFVRAFDAYAAKE